MTGFAVAMLAYGLMCTGLLIVVLGAVDDLKAALRQERAAHRVEKLLRLAGDELLSHEQLAIRDIAVGTDTPVRDVAAHLERALTGPTTPSTLLRSALLEGGQ